MRGLSSFESTSAALRPRLQSLLPTDLVKRLDREMTFTGGLGESAEALQEVLDTLRSLKHNLGTYLPRSLVLSSATPGVPRGELLEGTVLFVDVTGFTPLAEGLRTMGEEGAEHLNQMINDLFTALLTPLFRLGGELLIFAGDAMQAFFPAADHAQDAIQATQAALLMVRAIAPFDQGSTPLTVSVGLARGCFFAAQVGTAQRMEYLITGGPIQQSIKAEAQASPRQISLAPGLELLLIKHFRLMPIADGYHIVTDDLDDRLEDLELHILPAQKGRPGDEAVDIGPNTLIKRIDTVLTEIEAIAPFFPPNVLRRIVAHQRERQFPGEHRLVAVMFVNLRGFEELIEALDAEQLSLLTYWINRYFVEAQETLAGCGGLVTHVDPYDKGFTLLCPFGAPLADEDTPHRATAAAIRLNEKLLRLNQDLNKDLRERALLKATDTQSGLGKTVNETNEFLLTHHIGITYGPIYTGQVGWRERREYVVVGDDVNLSARLMNKAGPNEILISGWVHDRVRQSER
jgi:adenylate cyclase